MKNRKKAPVNHRGIVKKFLVYVIENRKHIPMGEKLFSSEEEAWYWVDTNFKSDEDRLRFYLADVLVSSSR